MHILYSPGTMCGVIENLLGSARRFGEKPTAPNQAAPDAEPTQELQSKFDLITCLVI